VQVATAIPVAGGAYAYQADVAVMPRGLAVRAHQQPPRSHCLFHKLIKARLEHGRATSCQQRHLLRVHVDADCGMAVLRQTRCGDATDIAEAKDTNPHVYLPSYPQEFHPGGARSSTHDVTERKFATPLQSVWRPAAV